MKLKQWRSRMMKLRRKQWKKARPLEQLLKRSSNKLWRHNFPKKRGQN